MIFMLINFYLLRWEYEMNFVHQIVSSPNGPGMKGLWY